jgi:hypothetical protein
MFKEEEEEEEVVVVVVVVVSGSCAIDTFRLFNDRRWFLASLGLSFGQFFLNSKISSLLFWSSCLPSSS